MMQVEKVANSGPINEETIAYLSRARLLELLGFQAASRLVEKFGGTRLSIPAPESAGYKMLADVLEDKKAADRLCVEYGGLRVILPVRVIALQARVRELHRGGIKPPEIARALGCTERRVYQVLAENIKL